MFEASIAAALPKIGVAAHIRALREKIKSIYFATS
jgi:hypothetical protein